MRNNPLHPATDLPFALLDGVAEGAQEFAKKAARKYHEAHRRRVGATLRPGPATPMWNALAAAAKPYLSQYGEKSKLARILGVYPSRVYEYFRAGGAMPDAERTLQLMHYVALKRAGRSPD